MNELVVAVRTGTEKVGHWGPIGRLAFQNNIFRFAYTHGAKALEGFQPFTGMTDLDKVYESSELLPIFSNRLMSSSRAEYKQYLHWSGFDTGSSPDPLAILAVNQGLKQTDLIEVFPVPKPNSGGHYEGKFFLHGLRHMNDEAKAAALLIKNGQPLFLVPEPSNQYDRTAVAIHLQSVDGVKIGYVPRYLTEDFGFLREHCNSDVMKVWAEQVNPDAPLQQRLLCGLKACWPTGFKPFSTEPYRTIPDFEESGIALG
jgi:HIRAN domain